MKAKNKVLLAYFGHHKCGTGWINRILRTACNELGLHFVQVNNPKMFDYNLREFVEKRNVEFLSYANADYHYVKDLPDFKGLHVIRDPRDIVVSSYFSHLYSHSTREWPELENHRQQLQKQSEVEGLKTELKFRSGEFERMRQWNYDLENIIELKMEAVIKNPRQQFLDIFRYFGILDEESVGIRKRLKHFLSLFNRIVRYASRERVAGPFRMRQLPAERVLGIVDENDFARLSKGRQPGQEDVKSHYRKGQPGDWKNYFNEEHIKLFKSRYSNILVQSGYEHDPHW
jgi:hypothetical protein